MKWRNVWTGVVVAGIAIAVPSIVVAQETDASEKPSQPNQQYQPMDPTEPAKPTAPAEATQQTEAEMRGHLIPIVAGVQSTQVAVAGLKELMKSEPFMRKDARETLEIGEKAIGISHGRAQQFAKRGPAASRADAEQLASALKAAKSQVDKVKRQVGVEGALRRDELEKLRTELPLLETALSDAHMALDKVAKSYNVATRLQTDTPAMGK
jgi:hypothetical protein